jgi:isopenicillin-N epimerase
MQQIVSTGITRRGFARLLAGSSAALLAPPVFARQDQPGPRWSEAKPLWQARPGQPAAAGGESFWEGVREQFVIDPGLAPMNAANLCPASRAVLTSLYDHTRAVDRDPSPAGARRLQTEAREETRRMVAAWLRVSPEEIVLTRNTSESNNIVSSGLSLGAGDEVVIFSDNHPSNHQAWRDKATRFGFIVRLVAQVSPHPGPEHYLDAFLRETTGRTRVWAFTHLTNSVGELFPARELCQAARDRGILTLVDGAQTLGLLDLDLADMQADFFTGSGHKWPCGPRETGVLYVRKDAQDRIAPSVISLYAGTTGISRTLEAFGQRDDAAVVAFGEAVQLQAMVGMAAVQARSRELAEALMVGLRKIDGVRLWTHPAPERSAAVVTFQPGSLDPRRLGAALYEREGIVCAVRAGDDRPGIRLSPHFYNLHAEVDRTLAAVQRYVRTGI